MKERRRIRLLFIMFAVGFVQLTYGQAAHSGTIEPVVQTGHGGTTTALAFSHDGDQIAIAGKNNTVGIFRLNPKLHLLRTIRVKDQGAGFYDLQFSHDNRLLAYSSSWGSQIQIFDNATGKEMKRFVHSGQSLRATLFSPNDKYLVSYASLRPGARQASSIRAWNLENDQEVSWIKIDGEIIEAIVFSKSDELKVITTDGKAGLVLSSWNFLTNSRKILRKIDLAEKIYSVAANPTRGLFAVGGKAGNLSFFDLSRGNRVAVYNIDTESIKSLEFSPDGSLIAAAIPDSGKFGEVGIWKAGDGERVSRSNHPISFTRRLRMAFSPDNRLLARGSKIVNVRDGETSQEFLKDILLGVKHAVLIPRHGKLAFARGFAAGSSIVELDLPTASNANIRYLRETYADCLEVSQDQRFLASTTRKGEVELYSFASGTVEKKYLHGGGGPGGVLTRLSPGTLSFSKDGKYLASSGAGLIKVWDLQTDKTVVASDGFGAAIAYFSPDSRWLVIKTKSYVYIYRTSDWKKVRTIDPYKVNLFGGGWLRVSFSLDSRYLTIANWQQDSIYLLDLKADFKLRRWGSKVRGGGEVVWSNDSRLLAVRTRTNYTDQGVVEIFDVSTGNPVHKIQAHADTINDIYFVPGTNLLMTASEDGSIKFWDLASGKLACALLLLSEFPYREITWLSYAPSGHFDGSPDAFDKLYWRFGDDLNNVLPIESFFKDFYHPGLLSDVLRGNAPKRSINIADIDRRLPLVLITVPEGKPGNVIAASQEAARKAREKMKKNVYDSEFLDVTVKVEEVAANKEHDAGSGVFDVRLFRNGVLVKAWKGNALKGRNSRAVFTTRVKLTAGENELVANAFNRDNVKSLDAYRLVKNRLKDTSRPNAFIIAIGINDYSNPRFDLKFAVPDAEFVAAELKKSLQSSGYYGEVKVQFLDDSKATKKNIEDAIRQLAGAGTDRGDVNAWPRSRPKDAVFVYYSGHGAAIGNEFYLIPSELGPALDSLVQGNKKRLLRNALSGGEIETLLEGVDSGNIMLIIDACNSGKVITAPDERQGPLNTKGLAQLAYDKGLNVLTASQSHQAAIGTSYFGHGIMTHALISEGLLDWSADIEPKDKTISAREWLNYTSARVPRLHQELIALKKSIGDKLRSFEEDEIRAMWDTPEELERQSRLQSPKIFRRRALAKELIVAKIGNEDKKPSQPKSKKYNLSMNIDVDEIRHGNDLIKLKQKINLKVQMLTGSYAIDFRPLGIISVDSDYYAMLNNFYKTFIKQYDVVMSKNAKNLSAFEKTQKSFFEEHVLSRSQ